jgi:hypothetical protein
MPLSDDAIAKLDANYNQQGAMGGLFAPAYVPGYAPSEQALTSWQSGRGLTGSQVDQTTIPAPWAPPQDNDPYAMARMGMGGGMGIYGPNLAGSKSQFGMKESVDPNALRAAAQNTPYDFAGRRGQVAQQLMANQAAKDAYYNPKATAGGAADLQSMMGYVDPYSVRRPEYLQD